MLGHALRGSAPMLSTEAPLTTGMRHDGALIFPTTKE
jgi:hypothetical protein